MKLKTFKTLQHNVTCILHINSSNKMFFSIHDFTFLMTDRKIKRYVSFESSEKKKLLLVQFSVKFVMLPVQSFTLANWFACVPACMSVIVQVSLTSLVKAVFHQQIYLDKLMFFSLWKMKGRTPCFSTKKSEVRIVL